MGKKLYNETCDVIFRRKSDGAIVFTTVAQLASISQKVQVEKIKGGLGNGDVCLLKSQKEIELKVRNALLDEKWIEMALGVSFNASGEATVFEYETAVAESATVIPIVGVPKVGSIIKIIAADGTEKTGTYAAGDITTTGLVQSDTYTVIYQKDVTGKSIEFRMDKFSEAYEVQYKTIAQDTDTYAVTDDVYVNFYKVLPSDDIEIGFEAGKAITPEFTFTVLKNGDSPIVGKWINVPRP